MAELIDLRHVFQEKRQQRIETIICKEKEREEAENLDQLKADEKTEIEALWEQWRDVLRQYYLDQEKLVKKKLRLDQNFSEKWDTTMSEYQKELKAIKSRYKKLTKIV